MGGGRTGGRSVGGIGRFAFYGLSRESISGGRSCYDEFHADSGNHGRDAALDSQLFSRPVARYQQFQPFGALRLVRLGPGCQNVAGDLQRVQNQLPGGDRHQTVRVDAGRDVVHVLASRLCILDG